jgi:hypothetical protein
VLISEKAPKAIPLVDTYISGDGKGNAVYKKPPSLRNEHQAGRQLKTRVRATGATEIDEEIEEFYQDNSKLVHILLGTLLLQMPLFLPFSGTSRV